MFCKLNVLIEKTSFINEIEVNNQIPFLDILNKKSIAKFLTSVYRKTSFSGRYLHLQPFCTKNCKNKLDKNFIPSGLHVFFPNLLHSKKKYWFLLIKLSFFLEKHHKERFKPRSERKTAGWKIAGGLAAAEARCS